MLSARGNSCYTLHEIELGFSGIVQAPVQDMSGIHVTGGRAHCKHQVAFFISIDPKISTSVAPPSNESTEHGLITGNYNYRIIPNKGAGALTS